MYALDRWGGRSLPRHIYSHGKFGDARKKMWTPKLATRTRPRPRTRVPGWRCCPVTCRKTRPGDAAGGGEMIKGARRDDLPDWRAGGPGSLDSRLIDSFQSAGLLLRADRRMLRERVMAGPPLASGDGRVRYCGRERACLRTRAMGHTIACRIAPVRTPMAGSPGCPSRGRASGGRGRHCCRTAAAVPPVCWWPPGWTGQAPHSPPRHCRP
jgi:hypothetical protein